MDFTGFFVFCGKDPCRVADTLGIPLPEVFRRMKALGLKSGHHRTPAYYKRVITEYRDEYLFNSMQYISKCTGISSNTLRKYLDESHDIEPRMPINRWRALLSASQDPSGQAATICDMPSLEIPSTASYSITILEVKLEEH